MKLWQKDYKLDKEVEEFTVGNDYLLDQRLVKHDCLASIAHAKMLAKIGIITKDEAKKLVKALEEVMELSRKGKFIVKKQDEDCHTSIENFLTKKLGNLGKKIHTARSRNDQVLTALRLYYKEEIKKVITLVEGFAKLLKSFKSKHGSVKLPGYTHMRKAMASSVATWAGSFIDSMQDNKKLLLSAYDLIDQSPLGTGAGYGVPLKLNRKLTAKLLGFKRIQKNPVYVQNSRGKFEATIIHCLSQLMFDLNKIASDIVLFTMPELDYFELPDELCTGSSIMPHKKNPDVLELARAKYHEVIAYEFQVKSLTSNLISGYNRDLQLTKEPVMKSFDAAKETMNVMSKVVSTLKVKKERCSQALTEELCSVKKAYDLVKKGVAFRDAYKKVAKDF